MNLKEEWSLSNEQVENVKVTLVLNEDIQQVEWDPEIHLLDAILNAGINAPYSCGRGTCGTCVCKLEKGEVRMRRNFVLSEVHLHRGLILPCVTVPISPDIQINYDKF